MRSVGVILIALAASGCLAYHSSRTEKLDAETAAVQERRIVELERQIETLRKEYVAVVQTINSLDLKPSGPPAALVVNPKIAATVTAVDQDRNIVTLSVGFDDGVRPGHEFTVYSGDRYIGKVIVEMVRGEWCRGTSKKELQVKPIEVGHEARTRW